MLLRDQIAAAKQRLRESHAAEERLHVDVQRQQSSSRKLERRRQQQQQQWGLARESLLLFQQAVAEAAAAQLETAEVSAAVAEADTQELESEQHALNPLLLWLLLLLSEQQQQQQQQQEQHVAAGALGLVLLPAVQRKGHAARIRDTCAYCCCCCCSSCGLYICCVGVYRLPADVGVPSLCLREEPRAAAGSSTAAMHACA